MGKIFSTERERIMWRGAEIETRLFRIYFFHSFDFRTKKIFYIKKVIFKNKK